MKNKIYIEMGKFIEQYNNTKDDAIFSLKIRDSLKKDLKNLSNKYNLIILTTYNLDEIKKWLLKYNMKKYFSEFYLCSLEKLQEDDGSIPYYTMTISFRDMPDLS